MLESTAQGYPPTMIILSAAPYRPITERERSKYQSIWGFEEYHNDSPGEQMIEMFERVVRPAKDASIWDIGCGAGAGTKALLTRGYKVSAFDLVDVAGNMPVSTGAIWRNIPHFALDYCYCTDVMEHIPTELVGLSIEQILQRSRNGAFFSISFQPDNFGAFIEQTLHLTVRDFKWWVELFQELGTLKDARDMLGQGVFYVTH